MPTLTIKNRDTVYPCVYFTFEYTGTKLSDVGVVRYITCGGFETNEGTDFSEMPEETVLLTICAKSIIDTSFFKDVTDYTSETPCN